LYLRFLIVIKGNMLLPGKYDGNAQIHTEARWEMHLKALLRSFEQYLKGIGDSLKNARRVLETFSTMLSEE
jgi:hypothetical protein